MAFTLSSAGDHEEALGHFLTSLALRRRAGFRLYLPFSLVTVADELPSMGRPRQAEAYASEARTRASEIGYDPGARAATEGLLRAVGSRETYPMEERVPAS